MLWSIGSLRLAAATALLATTPAFAQSTGQVTGVVKDSTGALVLYPVARTSVVSDPDVIKAQPLQPVYAEQNKGNTNPWTGEEGKKKADH